MPILTSDFPALTDDLESIWNESSKTAVAEMVGNKIFSVKDEQRRTHDHRLLHGLDVIQLVAQGGELPAANSVQGDGITFTKSRYGGLVSVTKDMRIYDLHDEINSIVRSSADDAFHKVDQSMADVLGNGFSAANYTDVYDASVAATGPDGLALFSAAHTNAVNATTFSNIISYPAGTNNPALSREAVVRNVQLGLTYIDPLGLNRPVRFDTLLVAPSNFDLATRIVESDKVQGSSENDTNMFLRGKLKVLIWERLETRTGGTDTSAYWYMFDSRKVGETLMAHFAERPSLDPPEQVYKTKNWDYSVDFYYSLGRGWAAYLRGSTGAN